MIVNKNAAELNGSIAFCALAILINSVYSGFALRCLTWSLIRPVASFIALKMDWHLGTPTSHFAISWNNSTSGLVIHSPRHGELYFRVL